MLEIDRSGRVGAVWTAILVTVLWSSSWVLIRIVLDDESLAPITFAGMRYTLAAAVLAAWVVMAARHRRQVVELDSAMVKRLVVLGVVFFAVTQGAQFVAIDNQPAATVSLMLAPTPFVVALLSSRSLGERSTVRQFLGAGLMVVGAVLYFAGDLGATVIGMIASTVGLGANVSGAILGRSVNREHRVAPVVVTTVSMTIGAVTLLAVGVTVEGWPRLTLVSTLIIGWLAVVNTAVAFTLWNSAQRRLSAAESSAINGTMLIQIAGLAWLFLGEAPGVVGVAGILVVSIGVFLAQAPNRQSHGPTAPDRARQMPSRLGSDPRRDGGRRR